jgi:hypothetical protein
MGEPKLYYVVKDYIPIPDLSSVLLLREICVRSARTGIANIKKTTKVVSIELISSIYLILKAALGPGVYSV